MELENGIENLILQERERIYLKLDAIINAHLWGDYSFNGREMWEEANKYIKTLK